MEEDGGSSRGKSPDADAQTEPLFQSEGVSGSPLPGLAEALGAGR